MSTDISCLKARVLIVCTVVTTLRAFLLPFADHFRALGWRVDGAAVGATTDPEIGEHFDRVHELPLSRRPWSPGLVRAPAAIRRLVRQGEYDLVHVHTPVAAMLVRFALRHDRVKVVYTAHGFHFFPGGGHLRNGLFRALERVAARWCDAIITINAEDFAAASAFHDRVRYMPGIGIDLAGWTPEPLDAGAARKLRDTLALPEDAVPFLMVAEMNPGKRHRDALAALAKTPPQVHLLFAGQGLQMSSLKEFAAFLGVADRAHFLGYRRDIKDLMRLSRAVLLPSAREGLPRSLLESLALGVPVIVSDARGCAELGRLGGRVHPVGDAGALAEAMRDLAADAGGAAQLGAEGRRRLAEGGYDIRAILRAHEALYRELLC